MGNQLGSLTDPLGLRGTLEGKPLEVGWSPNPLVTGVDAIDLADALDQLGVGLGGDIPSLTGGETSQGQDFRNKASAALLELLANEPTAKGVRALQAGQAAEKAQMAVAGQPQPTPFAPGTDETAGQGQDPALAAAMGPQITTLRSGSWQRTGIKPDKKRLATAEAQIQEGLEEQEQAAEESALDAEGFNLARQTQMGRADKSAQEAAEQWQPQVDEARQQRDQVIADLQQSIAEAKEDVDPDRWWNTRGGGQKVAIIAAAMLGGFTEGFTWGKVRDKSLGMMERMIDRDIAAQESAIRNARAKRGEMQGLVAALNGKLGDLETAKKAAKASIYEDLSRRFDMIASNAKEVSIARKAQAIAGHLKMQAGEGMRGAVLQAADRVTSGGSSRQVIAQPGAVASGSSAKTERKYAEYAAQIRNAAGQLHEHNKAVASISPVWGVAGRYVPGIQTDPKVIEANRQRLAARIAKGEGVGQLAVDERKVYAESLVSPGSTQGAKLRATTTGYNGMLRGLDNKIKMAKSLGDTAGVKQLEAAKREITGLAAEDVRMFAK